MTHYFLIGDHLRRTIDGHADCCPDCGLPRRFSVDSREEIDHPCDTWEVDDDETAEEIKDLKDAAAEREVARLDFGLSMQRMGTDSDYGGVIE